MTTELVLERFFQRLDEVVDRFLTGGQIGLRALLKFFQMRFRKFEESLVVALQGFGGEGIERITQPLFGVGGRFHSTRPVQVTNRRWN